jgi:hypothetical protein
MDFPRRRPRPPKNPGQFCRCLGLSIGVVGLASCTTTYHLGSVADPAVVRAIDAAADQPRTFAVVKAPPAPLDPLTATYAVVGHAPGTLLLADRAASAPVPLLQLESVSRFDRARGARDGAIGAGLVGFALGAITGVVVSRVDTGAADDASPRTSAPVRALEYGAVVALTAAAVGAVVGAVAGHEDRYEVTSGIDDGTVGLSRIRPTVP